jgi:hypothetical protein
MSVIRKNEEAEGRSSRTKAGGRRQEPRKEGRMKKLEEKGCS